MYSMWVVTKASIGADTMTLAASTRTSKVLKMAKISENPRTATADE